MGIFDTTTASNVRPLRGAAAADRPQAKVWINIGVTVGSGENAQFISLPVGIPLDTMEAVEARGQNADWVKLQNARNAFLKTLQDKGNALAPGEFIEVPHVEVQLRHVANKMEIADDENELVVDFSKIFGEPVAAE